MARRDDTPFTRLIMHIVASDERTGRTIRLQATCCNRDDPTRAACRDRSHSSIVGPYLRSPRRRRPNRVGGSRSRLAQTSGNASAKWSSHPRMTLSLGHRPRRPRELYRTSRPRHADTGPAGGSRPRHGMPARRNGSRAAATPALARPTHARRITQCTSDRAFDGNWSIQRLSRRALSWACGHRDQTTDFAAPRAARSVIRPPQHWLPRVTIFVRPATARPVRRLTPAPMTGRACSGHRRARRPTH